MRKTKSAPSVRRKRSGKPRRTRSAPKRISTSKKKKSKKRSKKISNPRMFKSIVPPPLPELDWMAAHPDQHARLQKAQGYRSFHASADPMDWPLPRYPRNIPSSHVELLKGKEKKGGRCKSRRKSKRKSKKK